MSNPFIPLGSMSESDLNLIEENNTNYVLKKEEEAQAIEFSTLSNLFSEKFSSRDEAPSPGFERLMYYLDTISWVVGRDWFRAVVPEIIYDWKTYKMKIREETKLSFSQVSHPTQTVIITSGSSGLIDPTSSSLSYTPLSKPKDPTSLIQKTERTDPTQKEKIINPNILQRIKWQKQVYEWCQVFSLDYLLNRILFIFEDSHPLLQGKPFCQYKIDKLPMSDSSGKLYHKEFENLKERYITVRGNTFQVHTIMVITQLWADTIYRSEMVEAQTLVSKPLVNKLIEHAKSNLTRKDSIPKNIEFPDNPKVDDFLSREQYSSSDDFVLSSRGSMSNSGERKVVKKGDFNWVDDSKASWCFDCKSSFFTFPNFNRKHHCRGCGQIFCDKCLSKTDPNDRRCRRCVEDDLRLSLSKS